MEELIRSGAITVQDGFRNVSYILEDDRLFLSSGYKIMMGMGSSGLSRCSRVLHNGKIKLVYFTDEKRPFSELAPLMNFPAFMSVAERIIQIVCEVENNGFLQCSNLNLSFERIYVDPDNFEVWLQYLPLNTRISDNAVVETDLRNSLADLIRESDNFPDDQAERACSVLADRSLSLEAAGKALSALGSGQLTGPKILDAEGNWDATHFLAANIRLICENPEFSLTFHIHQDRFVIGKAQESADGVIYHSTVSRKHCQILHDNGKYYVEDLDSTNGTRLNGMRIPSSQRKPIQNGDRISIADIVFRVDC